MINGGLRVKGITKCDTKEHPLITVITVVYNAETVLEKTIQSVVNQTYDNVEYIIIDGNSTDGTLDIIKKYEDKIDYWQSAPDGGIYDAMNKGVSLASGEWINFMNAGDCFFEFDTIKKAFENNNYAEYDIIYGKPYDEDKNPIKQYTLSKINLFLERNICHQAIFARNRTFENNNFDTSYRIIADRKWLYNSIKKNKFKFIDLPICIYDLTGISSNMESFSIESNTLQSELFGIYGKLERMLKKMVGK